MVIRFTLPISMSDLRRLTVLHREIAKDKQELRKVEAAIRRATA
jgi:hypothetical protein